MAKRVGVVTLGGPSMAETGEFRRLQPTAPKVEAPRAVRIEREGIEPLELPLYADRTYVFGRSAEATVVFPADAVSRLHGQLRFTDDAWCFRDLNSRNGSFLVAEGQGGGDLRRGAELLSGPEHQVHVGQTVLLGNGHSRLTFLSLPQAPEAPTPSAQSPVTAGLERAMSVCANHRLPVFLLGPSGSGKTFVARAIHERARMEGQFVLVNCGRLPNDPAQLASELLGHTRGAFTGALDSRVGRMRAAHQGTLFLDEVESLSPLAQDFLLDVIEGTGSLAPYGAPGDARVAPLRFRLISASKQPLASSGLRPDLCQRLAAGDVLVIPSLAERAADLPRFIEHFLSQLREEQRLDATLTPEAVRLLQRTPWAGELRELEATVKVVVTREFASRSLDHVQPHRLVIGEAELRAYLAQRQVGFGGAPEAPARKRPADLTVAELQAVLDRCGGNKTRAAKALGIAVNTLKARLR
jgi:transcriptional regulator with AAA-type ATPase domain